MSSWDKLLERILTLSNDLRFDELRKVLAAYGYEMKAPRAAAVTPRFVNPAAHPSRFLGMSPSRRFMS